MTRPRRIVIVEDDEGMRTLIRINVEFDDRFEIAAVVGSARELRAFLGDTDSGRIDAVVLDQSLPDAEGIALIAELRGRLSQAVRLVLYTGWSDPAVTRRAEEFGADQVISKSVDPRQLLDQIAVWWQPSRT